MATASFPFAKTVWQSCNCSSSSRSQNDRIVLCLQTLHPVGKEYIAECVGSATSHWTSHWDRYLGMMTAMTQYLSPLSLLNNTRQRYEFYFEKTNICAVFYFWKLNIGGMNKSSSIKRLLRCHPTETTEDGLGRFFLPFYRRLQMSKMRELRSKFH